MPDKKIKILLADDEANIRLLGEKFLKDAGYDVILAVDGNEAIEKAMAERPDLVITDIRMPNKTGFEVCKTLRSDPVLSRVPIIILSALGDEFNKLTGFEGGANDFLTKPFRTNELNDRITLLLEMKREQAPQKGEKVAGKMEVPHKFQQISTGAPALDKALRGGFPKGSNILLISPLGRGKSTFARKFVIDGLQKGEHSLYVAVDDDPTMVRAEFNKLMNAEVSGFEKKDLLRFVDAYTWSSGEARANEKFRVEGLLNLEVLSNLIVVASSDIGQSVQKKAGGRRVIDSISSFFVNFDLSAVQRFLSQIGRTALSFGGVTTLFVIEEGAVSEQDLNNIKYLMDGVLEFKEDYGRRKVRSSSMKWIGFEKDWVEW